MRLLYWLGFWGALGTLFYVYAGFPLLVIVTAWLRRKRVHQASMTPHLSLIIPCWNEEKTIATRLENALALDYPKDRLEIIVASDGSDDRTELIVEGYASAGVQLLRLPRRGKIYALNAAVEQATGEILVFSDANSMFAPRALQMLSRNFADPEVGGVCGNQIYLKHENIDAASQGETMYWSYDKWLKQMESMTGSIVSAHGAIYAIRRKLYQPPPSAAVTDDFAISTAVVEQGYRLVFEQEAIAYEHVSPATEIEFRRKVRILNRGLRAVFSRRQLLNPLRYSFYAVELLSHKVLRRLVPLFLVILFVASIQLSEPRSFYIFAAAGQILFYGLAGVGFLLRRHRLGASRLLCIPFFYCMANTAALAAFIMLLSGKRIALWEPQRF